VTTRTAACQCGQLSVTCTGDPVRISVCHCLNCQRRSGSSFAAQARFSPEHVTITGVSSEWTRISDEGKSATFHFCPDCGSTVYYLNESVPGLVAVAVGAFADPHFPPPVYSVYEERKHRWVEIVGDEIERFD
jgi:hypothetical protein